MRVGPPPWGKIGRQLATKRSKSVDSHPADSILQPGVSVLAKPCEPTDPEDTPAPLIPAEEVYGCFVKFSPAVMPEDIRVPKWMIILWSALLRVVAPVEQKLAHSAEFKHKLPYYKCAPFFQNTDDQQCSMYSIHTIMVHSPSCTCCAR
jgi:hypothetical protein